MSAPQIPNLNTLRRGGGGLRGRLRGRGRRGSSGDAVDDATSHENNAPNNSAKKDRIVQNTDNDASVSRLSAVDLGYLEDPFVRILTPSAGGPGSRRFPIINRGTYVRTTAIDELVYRFLDSSAEGGTTRKQIISLGAGSDTRVFRIFSKREPAPIVYHEIDFAVNTSAKIRAIRASPFLQKTLQIDTASGEGNDKATISVAGDALHSPSYHIHPVDLRTLAGEVAKAGSQTESRSSAGDIHMSHTPLLPGIDSSLPTLLISECCLIYLAPHDADAVVDYFSKYVFPSTTPLGMVIYEPIRPDDAFGKTMVSNLAARGIQLQTLHKYSSLAAQKIRLQDHSFVNGQGAADIDFIWDRWISTSEKERVATLEMLDEIEEWKLLAQHYCIAWGWRGPFGNWNDVHTQEAGS